MKDLPKPTDPQDLKLFKNAQAMMYVANRYFSAVLKAAEQDAEDDSKLLMAKNKAGCDPYYQAIMHQSNKTFRPNQKSYVPIYFGA